MIDIAHIRRVIADAIAHEINHNPLKMEPVKEEDIQAELQRRGQKDLTGNELELARAQIILDLVLAGKNGGKDE